MNWKSFKIVIIVLIVLAGALSFTFIRKSGAVSPISEEYGFGINSVELDQPKEYQEWNEDWGDNVKPEASEDYFYLLWELKTDFYSGFPLKLIIDSALIENFEGAYILGYRFSNQKEFSVRNSVAVQQMASDVGNDIRTDQILVAVPFSVYDENEKYLEVRNDIEVELQLLTDEKVRVLDKVTKIWSWTKPSFVYPGAHFDAFMSADGAYSTGTASVFRNDIHRASSLDFNIDEYTYENLEAFNKYNDTKRTLYTLKNFTYAAWMVGYPYLWTLDFEKGEAIDHKAYGQNLVTYELSNTEVFLKDVSDEPESEPLRLGYGDYKISSLGFSYYLSDAKFDEDTKRFKEVPVSYVDTDVLVFYGRFNKSSEWVEFASYDMGSGAVEYDQQYVKSMTNKEIVFVDKKVNLLEYKVLTSNVHYFTEIFTVPHITLKDSKAVNAFMQNKTEVEVINTCTGSAYNYAKVLLFRKTVSDVERMKVSDKILAQIK